LKLGKPGSVFILRRFLFKHECFECSNLWSIRTAYSTQVYGSIPVS
jgi:hypothetical protein